MAFFIKMVEVMLKKYLISLILIFVVCVGGCSQKKENKDTLSEIKKRGELVVGVKYDSKPFGFVKDGKLQGYDIDVAHLIAKRILGNERLVRFVEVNAFNRISKLNSGEVDMLIATMSINPQRAEIVDFSLPYYYVGQAVMVRKGTAIKNIGDLNGRRVIIVLGTTSETNIRYLAPEVIIQGYKSYQEGFEAFLNRRAEAMTSDDSILAGFVIDNPEFMILPQRYSRDAYAIAFRKEPASLSLKAEVDNAIAELRGKGYLSHLKSQWLPTSGGNFKSK